jgi:protein arginine kinase
MINEEDHLRMQVLRSGLHLNDAFGEISRIDNELSKVLNFAFSGKYGYLTACPTNVGTGLRVSVMLHLPGLKISGEIERAIQASRDLQLATRGLYGEGTDAIGDFYQISNQVTLGKSEDGIIDNFVNNYIPEILCYERRAREALMKNNRLEIEDKICRSLAIVRSARLICSDEALQHLSMIRLGINLQIISDVNLKAINELFLLSRPAHLQKIHGDELAPIKRDGIRSELLRTRLADPSSAGKES